MPTEDIGDGKDLELTDEDAESVVGGVKKKKKVTKKPVAKKPAVASAVTPVAPTTLPQMTQAEMEAYDKDLIDHGLDPVYGTTSTE